MMPGRRPEKLLARAVEPPATTGPTTATGSFCKAGDPSNPVLTVTTRLAGITETPEDSWVMAGRRPEELLARAVEPPATNGPTTATGSFCKAGDPSNPVLTVTTRLAGITETPVAATASPLPTGAATRTVFDPDWGEVGEKTGSTFTGS